MKISPKNPIDTFAPYRSADVSVPSKTSPMNGLKMTTLNVTSKHTHPSPASTVPPVIFVISYNVTHIPPHSGRILSTYNDSSSCVTASNVLFPKLAGGTFTAPSSSVAIWNMTTTTLQTTV